MKVRAGFVSNSSSSSFIVGFEHKVNSAEEMQKLLFGDAELWPDENSNWMKQFTTKEIVEQVFHDYERSNPATEEDIVEVMRSGYFHEVEMHVHQPRSWLDHAETKRYHDEMQTETRRLWLKLKPEFVGRETFIFTYSDNDGDFGNTMEHSDIFDRLPTIVVDMH